MTAAFDPLNHELDDEMKLIEEMASRFGDGMPVLSSTPFSNALPILGAAIRFSCPREWTMKLYTIGYGGRTRETFLSLLHSNGIRTVVDVRLRPDRSSMSVFKQARDPERGIVGLLTKSGFEYLWIQELGNIFVGQHHWFVPYGRLLAQSGELLTSGLAMAEAPVCLMCAELRHDECHRSLIAGWYADRHGLKVVHL